MTHLIEIAISAIGIGLYPSGLAVGRTMQEDGNLVDVAIGGGIKFATTIVGLYCLVRFVRWAWDTPIPGL
jgi:hypothetical protein